ncbi:unnamed protein product [Prunus armeniaca]|uniref:PGG domain-containing protein n=1 Tax=Prunus armeniaca TaxID=36596 RepID=A0A6J5UDE6_PRUAR|nr:unnamed protein product [Prunus armeniaca]
MTSPPAFWTSGRSCLRASPSWWVPHPPGPGLLGWNANFFFFPSLELGLLLALRLSSLCYPNLNNHVCDAEELFPLVRQEDLNMNPTSNDAIRERGSTTRGTALHLAVALKNVKMAKALVELMTEDDLEIQDATGQIAMAYAAILGITQLANLGHWELARYLYSVTPLDALLQDNGHVGAEIVSESFRAKNFDVALDLIRRCPNLALAKSYSGLTPLQVCAGTRSGFLSGMHLKFWQQWIYER